MEPKEQTQQQQEDINLLEEQIKGFHGQQGQEISLGNGIYYMDNRKSKVKEYVVEQEEIANSDPIYLTEVCIENKENIFKLKETIEEIQSEENWEKEQLYLDVISENYVGIHKLLTKYIPLLSKLKAMDPDNDFLKENTIEKLFEFRDQLEKEFLYFEKQFIKHDYSQLNTNHDIVEQISQIDIQSKSEKEEQENKNQSTQENEQNQTEIDTIYL